MLETNQVMNLYKRNEEIIFKFVKTYKVRDVNVIIPFSNSKLFLEERFRPRATQPKL